MLTETRLANVAAEDRAADRLPRPDHLLAGLFLLIFGLIRGNPEGWGSAQIVASLVGVGGAARSLRRRSRRAAATRCSTSSLFRKPAFNGVSAVAFCLSAGMFAMFLYLTLYIQGVLGY